MYAPPENQNAANAEYRAIAHILRTVKKIYNETAVSPTGHFNLSAADCQPTGKFVRNSKETL